MLQIACGEFIDCGLNVCALRTRRGFSTSIQALQVVITRCQLAEFVVALPYLGLQRLYFAVALLDELFFSHESVARRRKLVVESLGLIVASPDFALKSERLGAQTFDVVLKSAYHFVALPEFDQMVVEDEFLEHARVFDNCYGTATSSVRALLASGKHVILEIDWQGARQVKAKLPDTVGIFILPPSREQLEQRLRARGTDDESVIARRMGDADREMSHFHDAEYLVINDNFEQALFDLEAIIHSQGLTRERQVSKNLALIDSIPAENE